MPKKKPPAKKHDGRTRVPDGLCKTCWYDWGAELRGREYLLPVDGGGRIITLCDHHWVWRIEIGCGALAPVP